MIKTSTSTLCLALMTVMGCAYPHAEVNPGARLEVYRKVYVPPVSHDPRGVRPRVLARLKQAGFDVVDLQPGDSTGAQGTGFVITSDGRVLTCAHLLRGQTNATVWIEGKRYVGRVAALDASRDLAVIVLDAAGTVFVPLPLAAGLGVDPGHDVTSLGFALTDALGAPARVAKGSIAATVGVDDNPNQLQVSAELQPGTSGSPVLDAQGQAVGMITSTLNALAIMIRTSSQQPPNVSFAATSASVREFLSGVKITLPVSADQPTPPEKSLALVRAGIVTEQELNQPALVCLCRYVSSGIGHRFGRIELQFFDLKKGEGVMRVGQYEDNLLSTEDDKLDGVFAHVSAKFFPDKPNPFK